VNLFIADIVEMMRKRGDAVITCIKIQGFPVDIMVDEGRTIRNWSMIRRLLDASADGLMTRARQLHEAWKVAQRQRESESEDSEKKLIEVTETKQSEKVLDDEETEWTLGLDRTDCGNLLDLQEGEGAEIDFWGGWDYE
jgi:hypothetical protein